MISLLSISFFSDISLFFFSSSCICSLFLFSSFFSSSSSFFGGLLTTQDIKFNIFFIPNIKYIIDVNNCTVGIIKNINELFEKIESELKANLVHFNILNENTLFNSFNTYSFLVVLIDDSSIVQ